MSEKILASRRVRFGAPGVAILLLAAVAFTVFQFNSAQTASAVPAPYTHVFQGPVRVRIKDGNIWKVIEKTVCISVVTEGQDGKILDALIGSSDTFGGFANFIACEGTFDGSVDIVEVDQLPGSEPPHGFIVDTSVDIPTYGEGWKAPPIASGKNAATFTMGTPADNGAGAVVDNNGFERGMNPGTKFYLKFVRDRGGVYFKINGFLGAPEIPPLATTGKIKLPAKVAFEIEALNGGAGFDSPPMLLSPQSCVVDDDFGPVCFGTTQAVPAAFPAGDPPGGPFGSDTLAIDSDNSDIDLTFSEPVDIDDALVFITCSDTFENAAHSFPYNPPVSGSGTNWTVTYDGIFPTEDLACWLFVIAGAVTDVDTIDDPDTMIASRAIPFWILGVPF